MTTTHQPSYDDAAVGSAGPHAAVHPDPAPARRAAGGPDRTPHDQVVTTLGTVAPAA